MNRATNAVWFARVGVYESIDPPSLQDPGTEINTLIGEAQIREAAALAELDVAEREKVFIEFSRDCARLAIHGGEVDSLDPKTNVVQVAFGQT